jgi:hypothetical protein
MSETEATELEWYLCDHLFKRIKVKGNLKKKVLLKK